jgi:predicted Ser/Thr protein kinase
MAQGSTSMAVDPKHAGRDAARAAGMAGDYDDPTEDLAADEAGSAASHETGRPPVAAVPVSAEAAGPDPFEPGHVLCGRYELERVVGRGGFCVVLAARDLRRQAAGDDDARVAIKVLRPELRRDDAARSRLTAEFRQLQQLTHAGIVRIYDLDRHGDDWFLVMELLEGVSLAGLIKHCEGGRLPEHKALSIVKDCAGALGWAHGRGIVHGDVKPGNVFVTRDEGVRLLDFGMASAGPGTDGQAEDRAAGFATPAYASPQVLQGREPVAADDIYSLACVAFELLSGSHPFDRLDAREAWARELHPGPTPELDAGLRDALERGLSFDRERRPKSIEAFIALLESEAPAAAPAGPAVMGRPPLQSRSPWWAAVAILAVTVVAFLLFRGDPAEPPPQPMPGESAPATRQLQEVLPGTAAATEAAPSSGEPATVTRQQDAPDGNPAAERSSDPAPAASPPRQRVGFDRAGVLVSRSAPAAAIPLRRIAGSNGRAVVRWRIDEGSARSGRDFTGPLSGSLVLADGQEAGTVFVPLLAAQGAMEDRAFSVVIDGVDGAARAGNAARVDVTLRSFVREQPRSLASRE